MLGRGHHVGVIPLIVSQALGRLDKTGGSGAVTACQRTADKQDSGIRTDRADAVEHGAYEVCLQVTNVGLGTPV